MGLSISVRAYEALRFFLVVAMVSALSSCGGGGGSDGGNPSPSEPDDPPIGSDSEAGITFPTSKGIALRSFLVVRGVARDGEGVAEVLVNNQRATITPGASANQAPALASAAAADMGSRSQEVMWEAVVPISSGENTVSVTVTDEDGNTTVDVDSTTVTQWKVPTNFNLDVGMNRVLGIYPNIYGFNRQFVEYDYLNQHQRILHGNFDSSGPACYKPDSGDYFHLLLEENNTLVLHNYNLSTDVDNMVSRKSVDLAMEGFDNAVFIRDMVCGSGEENVYLLINYTKEEGAGGVVKSTILKFPVDGSDPVALSETDPEESPAWISDEIVLGDTSIISHHFPSSPLISVDLETGNRTELSSFGVNAAALAENSNENTVYTAFFDGVYKVDVEEETVVNISEVDDSDPFVFSQVRKASYDSAGNRVIVSDSDLDALIAVDIATGERSKLLALSIGNGTRLIAPRAFQISSDGSKAYIADDGQNAPEKLFEVDLETGDRTLIADINQTYNLLVTGLAINEPKDKVFVAFDDRILEVDLNTGLSTIIASNSIGSGVVLSGVSDMLLDELNNRLILSDAVNETLVAVDLDTHDRSLISAASRGTGDNFANINSLVLSVDGTTVYASNQLSENIMAVDVDSGNREIILDECTDAGGENVLGVDETLQQILLDEASNRLLIRGDNILALDLESQSCSVLQDFVSGASVLDLQFNANGQVLATAFGSLGEYDLQSGEYVLISK